MFEYLDNNLYTFYKDENTWLNALHKHALSFVFYPLQYWKNAMQKFILNISLTFLTLTQHHDTCWETNNVFYIANVCLCPSNFWAENK